MAAAKQAGTEILPIDSEISAIFQSLAGHNREELRRIILTASGGPFREMDPAGLEKVTAAQALAHPNWEMGPKITIDSATLMNKGLEAIEAAWLFGLEPGKNIDPRPPHLRGSLGGGVHRRFGGGPDGRPGHAAAHRLRSGLSPPAETGPIPAPLDLFAVRPSEF